MEKTVPDELTHEDLNNGAGIAAYLIVHELIGLLAGMGLQPETVATLMTRAREKAEDWNRQNRSPAFRAGLQILVQDEAKHQQGRRPRN